MAHNERGSVEIFGPNFTVRTPKCSENISDEMIGKGHKTGVQELTANQSNSLNLPGLTSSAQTSSGQLRKLLPDNLQKNDSINKS